MYAKQPNPKRHNIQKTIDPYHAHFDPLNCPIERTKAETVKTLGM